MAINNLDLDEDDSDFLIEFRSSSQNRGKKRKCVSKEDDTPSALSAKRFVVEKAKFILFIQMELCSGMDLQIWMRNTRSRGRNFLKKVMADILSAVAYIHSKNYIHRDLKPSNIFITANNLIKIGDFGLVKQSSLDVEEIFNRDIECCEMHTSNVGSTLYLSPELENSLLYSYPTDVYSIGIIWVELLNYFVTETERFVSLKNLRKGIYPIDFSAKYSLEYEIITSMLADNPDARPTADEAYARCQLMYMNNNLKADFINQERELELQTLH